MVQSDGLGQPHAVVGPVEYAEILSEEHIPEDPRLGGILALEATEAVTRVLEKAGLR